MKPCRALVAVSLTLFAYSLSHILPARAADGPVGLGVSPVLEEVTLKPTDNRQDFQLQLSNHTPTTETIHLREDDFSSLDENGGVAFIGSGAPTVGNRYGLASWISLEKDRVTLEPGETQELTVSVLNADSLSPGGHYGAIIGDIEAGDGAAGGSQSVTVRQAFSSLIFVKKTGGEIYDLRLDGSLRLSALHWGLPRQLTLRFQNAGNVHAVPRGTVEIIDPSGRTVASGIINEESAIVLPESFRLLTLPIVPISPAWRPGKYDLRILYRFDGQESFTTITTPLYPTFLQSLLASLAASGFVILLVAAWRRIWHKRGYASKRRHRPSRSPSPPPR